MRINKTLLAVFICLLTVLIVCLIIVVKSSPKKSPFVFDDSDLIPISLNISTENNAFWTLLKATNDLYWPEADQTKFINLTHGTNWDDSVAVEVLKKNQDSLELFYESWQQPFLLVPEPKAVDEDYPYLSNWKAFSYLESIHAESLFRAHDEKDAFHSALKIIQFGQRVENCGGVTIHYLVGSSIKAVGLNSIQQMTAQTKLSETNLIELIQDLDHLKANQDGFVNSLKFEYQTESKFLDDFAAGKTSLITNSVWQQLLFPIGIKSVLDVAKTKMEFAQTARVIRDNFTNYYSEIAWTNLPVIETNTSTFELLIKGNAVGDILFQMLQPSLKTFAIRKSREGVDVTATQLLLALKIYKMKNGILPNSLSELVPEFFSQVPVDDFDGKPFRYLSDKKIIYSVGPDLKDSGGKERQKNSDEYDLPFKINF